MFPWKMADKEYNLDDLLGPVGTPETLAYEHALDITYAVAGIMEEQGLNQSELAQKMGIKKQALSKIFTSKPNMTLETIAKFELALDAKFMFQLKPNKYSDELEDVLQAPSENERHRISA